MVYIVVYISDGAKDIYNLFEADAVDGDVVHDDDGFLLLHMLMIIMILHCESCFIAKQHNNHQCLFAEGIRHETLL